MQLKWIKLENIRSYTSAKIDFPLGTTLLSGDIGSGKSSVLLAIEFALFGINKGELSGSALLRKGERTGSVELCFSVENKEVIIKRILKKSKDAITQAPGYIIINNVKRDATPVELKSAILSLLGYPDETLTKKNMIFRYTVYTPQEDMKRIITENKDERLDTLRKVFGVDKYKRINENASIAVKRLKERCRVSEGIIADLHEKISEKESMKKSLSDINASIAPLVEKKKEAEKKVANISAIQGENKKRFSEFIKCKSTMAALSSELNEVSIQLQENSKSIVLLKEQVKEHINKTRPQATQGATKEEIEDSIASEEKKIAEIRQNLFSAMERRRMSEESAKCIREEIAKSKMIVSHLPRLKKRQAELAEKTKEKQTIIERYEKTGKELIILEKNEAALLSKITASKDTSSKIQSLDECPTCLQKVDEQHKQAVLKKESGYTAEVTMQLNRVKSQKESLSVLLAKIKLKISEIEAMERELLAIDAKTATLNAAADEIMVKENALKKELEKTQSAGDQEKQLSSISLGSMEKNLSVLKEKLRIINETRAALRILEDKKQLLLERENKESILNSREAELSRKKMLLAGEMSKFGDAEKDMNDTEKTLENEKTALNEINLILREKQTLEFSLRENIARISAEIEKKEREKKQLHKRRQYISWIEESFVNIISIIERNIMRSLYNEFNSLFTEWFDLLIEDSLITSKLDDEFTPLVQQNGYDIEISSLSGGEKTALALAYRLALNKVINDITAKIKTSDLIILDEPTDGFSTQQLDKIRDVLEKLNMPQVIIVSHENKIEGFVDSIIPLTKSEHITKIS
jgi:DNA repair protein SbcC/Rad50